MTNIYDFWFNTEHSLILPTLTQFPFSYYESPHKCGATICPDPCSPGNLPVQVRKPSQGLLTFSYEPSLKTFWGI